ncbi:MAG: agmatinase [Candidatus Nealsonbacteria bacterium]|nr:agmatinase [Candidatus Nealsonbacteria bacterium]
MNSTRNINNDMQEFLKYPKLEPFNFMGLDRQDYRASKVVIFPVPYSSTTCWKTWTNEGPQAIIEASRHMELYDIESKRDPSKDGIFTLESLEPSKDSPKETIFRIKKVIDRILKDKKFPLMLGGEHSITLGSVLSFKEKFSNFSVLQIDAHADLRNLYEGSKYHHGSVMRRIRELKIPVTQVGLRSISEEDAGYVRKAKIKTIFPAPDLPIDEIIATLGEKVYLTIDLDGLDPSIMPSVGTPEPGGLGWHELLNFIKQLSQKRKIIGADVVELAPTAGLHAPDFLAAKLVYKIISYTLTSKMKF